MTSTMDVSSTTNRSQVRGGLSSPRFEAAALRIDFQEPMDGPGPRSRSPQSCAWRRGQFGAQSRSLTPLAARNAQEMAVDDRGLADAGPPGSMTSTLGYRCEPDGGFAWFFRKGKPDAPRDPRQCLVRDKSRARASVAVRKAVAVSVPSQGRIAGYRIGRGLVRSCSGRPQPKIGTPADAPSPSAPRVHWSKHIVSAPTGRSVLPWMIATTCRIGDGPWGSAVLPACDRACVRSRPSGRKIRERCR